jgi:hypothetical protein
MSAGNLIRRAQTEKLYQGDELKTFDLAINS